MGRNLEAKCKQCRRVGEKLLLKGERCLSAKCGLVKRNYPPGFHGAKGKPRQTEYGIQLNEKQKAKKQYQLLEKQFRLTFEKAKSKGGNTGETFLQLLENRLDNAVYRAGLVSSRTLARQAVNHGHVIVNGRKVSIPSYQLKTGDIIKIKEKSKKSPLFRELAQRLKKAELPSWMNINNEDLSIKILHLPKTEDLKSNINMQMIVEYYSR